MSKPEAEAKRQATQRYEKPSVAWEEGIDLGPALALACGKFPGDQWCKNVGGGFQFS